jgi:hypothetical protein
LYFKNIVAKPNAKLKVEIVWVVFTPLVFSFPTLQSSLPFNSSSSPCLHSQPPTAPALSTIFSSFSALKKELKKHIKRKPG